MDEGNTAVAEPIEAPASASAPVLRPEAMASLEALSQRLGGGPDPSAVAPIPEPAPGEARPPIPPVAPAAPVAPVPPVAPIPPVPASDVPTLEDMIRPPGSAETPPAAAAKELPSVDEVFPPDIEKTLRTDKQRVNWKNSREHYAAMETRVKELEAAGASAKPDEAAQARIADLEARNLAMSKQVERVTLLEHPAFIQQFEAPLKQLRASATQIVKDAALDPEEFDRVMSLAGNERIKAFDALTAEMDSPTLRRRLERTMENIEEKENQRAQVLSDTEGNLAKLRTEEKIRQHQTFEQQAKQITALVDGVMDYFASNVKNPFFQKGEGKQYEKWNADMDTDAENVRDMVLNCKDEGQLTSAIAMGVKLPRVMAAYAAERKARLAAERQLAERNGARPNLDGGGGGGGEGENEEDDAGDYSVDSIRTRLRRTVRR